MGLTVIDILTIAKAKSDVVLLDMGDVSILNDAQRDKLIEIKNILDSLDEITMDDDLDSLKASLEEIRDR